MGVGIGLYDDGRHLAVTGEQQVFVEVRSHRHLFDLGDIGLTFRERLKQIIGDELIPSTPCVSHIVQ